MKLGLKAWEKCLLKVIPIKIINYDYLFSIQNVNKYLNIIPYYFKKNLVLFLILFFGFSLWFLKFPTYRYGSSYIIGSIIFSQFYIFKNFLLGKKFQNYLKIFIIFTIIIISLKYLSKYDKQKSIWPNIYSFSDTSRVTPNFKKIYKKDKFLSFILKINYICIVSIRVQIYQYIRI